MLTFLTFSHGMFISFFTLFLPLILFIEMKFIYQHIKSKSWWNLYVSISEFIVILIVSCGAFSSELIKFFGLN